MANVDNLCMACKRVDFCHYRQMSLPSDKNLQMVHKEELNIVFDHNWYNYGLLLFVVDEIESIGNSDQRLFLLNTEY